ncbi:hypothetical protein H2198_007191 [Neophaeococcomyces mojaviensis]|uniref:Uncharacterized protein n=1 Tax=Neophaeococcomyces mojaviensis TaxID=3383035 RepID=A0ACC3A156_9EURO|nr:hypothetical protein H2198_007191 [Knufia sp. JES_112]
MGVWTIIRTTSRYAFFYTLPLTALPTICGVLRAGIFIYWSTYIMVRRNIRALNVEQSRYDYLTISGQVNPYYSIPDPQPPFHVTQLWSLDWHARLGLLQPQEYGMNHGRDAWSIDGLAQLHGLVRHVHHGQPSRLTEMWVYVTSPVADPAQNRWDAAFNKLVQFTYTHPLPKNTEVFFVSAKDSRFLVGVWAVEAPSLMHFKVSDRTLAEIDTLHGAHEKHLMEKLFSEFPVSGTYNKPRADLKPVTVRSIDLPLHETRSIFPDLKLKDEFEQLKQLVTGGELYEEWPRYNAAAETMARFEKYLHEEIWGKNGSVLGILGKVARWVDDQVVRRIPGASLAVQVIESLAFNMGLVFAHLGMFAWSIGRSFLAGSR